MSDDELRQCMNLFSVEKLKYFLGDIIRDSIMEWDPHALFDKATLVNLLLSIYGKGIISDNGFRHELVNHLDAGLGFDNQWRDSPSNIALLDALGYDSADFFCDEDDKENPIQEIDSRGRFYELLDYQFVIRQKALNILISGKELSKFLIQMPTGTGKTKTAMHIICHHYNLNLQKHGLILWIAHTNELLEQAFYTFVSVWEHIGNGKITTYKLYGNRKCEIMDGMSGFMAVGIQKLEAMKRAKPNDFALLVKNAAFVVFDEAHKITASESSKVINDFMKKPKGYSDRSLMGLTATPGRTTDASAENERLANFFDGNIITIDTDLLKSLNYSRQDAANIKTEKDIIRYFQNSGVLAKVDKEELVYDDVDLQAHIQEIKVQVAKYGQSGDFTQGSLEIIARNKNRNMSIIKKLQCLNEEHKPTIVFACSACHVRLLSAFLSMNKISNVFVLGRCSA